MGSNRVIPTVVWQALLFGSGAAAALTWKNGFYASFVVALLVGLCLLRPNLARTLPPRPPAEPSMSSSIDVDRAMLRAVLDQAPTPLLVIAEDGRPRALNRAARSLFVTDHHILEHSANAFVGSSRIRHGERSYRIDRIEARGIGATHIIIALVDIENEERAAEARATRELLQVLSHEMMNSLTPIASLAESALAALHDQKPPIGSLREMIGTIARRTGGLQRFTEAYRRLARLPEPSLAPTSCMLLLNDLRRMFEARWQDQVKLEVDCAMERVIDIDREQVMQALWALLQNAAEAASSGLTIPLVRLSVPFDGANFSIIIQDNGPGIPMQDRDAIFRAFFTTRAEGNGIGLSLARQIARSHGGDVVLLANALTTFGMTFPNR